ncbi:MAG: phosphate/phosphite/phosphonate ABC transporter substrate-binding protein [Rhodospirillales bacterium]|nr:phosphate/phosphite/phosphonate ABC transporter substrate-binding protein [Rhodospirillales bacterium]MDE2575385.1 phosphate/phosphite/phosphonate ABC transporter substrate-binding protein [Rhodospirillales bacterium]
MKRSILRAAFAAAALAGLVPAAHAATDCPNGGTVRFGVEPYDATAKLVPIYGHVAKLIGEKLGCKVEVFIATSYNAEIEAMRSGKLEFGEFGPLGYVLAHEVAHAEAVATFSNKEGKPDSYTAGIVTWPGSGITKLSEVRGKSFAFADPASTSGHLFPAYWLAKNGIDPDHDIKGFYAGSHAASYEALRNHKVVAGELNSEQIASATLSGTYKASDFVELWRSNDIPIDPITVRGDLPAGFKARLVNVLQTLDLSSLPENDKKIIGFSGARLVPQNDAAFNPIRDLVHVLHIDLNKLS